jgi:DNA mismatch endonuclease, patch repair protein
VVDVVDSDTRSRMMAGIQGANTAPELFVRRALHALGLRYRLGGCGLPGRPDLVFPKYRAVVFIHGCFWHRHDCGYFKWPKTNPAFWREKLEGNVARDKRVVAQLKSAGWCVLTIWECEVRRTGYEMPNRNIQYLAKKLKSRGERKVVRKDVAQIQRKAVRGLH